MTLFWPDTEAEIVLNEPRLHVFIVGVGDYLHLNGGSGQQTKNDFGLQQLTCTRITAERLANWFVSDVNPPHPLGSVELLLSPKPKVTRTKDKKQIDIEPPLLQPVELAFNRWLQRCNAQADNIALFYFAGHGFSDLRQYLLPGDFGDPAFADHWKNCIDFTGLAAGMGSCAATTQVFFVDACRERFVDVALEQNVSGRSLISANINQMVPGTSIYFAASDGFQAFGPTDESDMTYFGQAVLRSLEGVGADNSHGSWLVDTFSMANAIAKILEQMSDVLNQALTCDPRPGSLSSVLHVPKKPIVLTAIDCALDMMITVRRKRVKRVSIVGDRRPWIAELAPGEWRIVVSDAANTFFDETVALSPPVFQKEVSK